MRELVATSGSALARTANAPQRHAPVAIGRLQLGGTHAVLVCSRWRASSSVAARWRFGAGDRWLSRSVASSVSAPARWCLFRVAARLPPRRLRCCEESPSSRRFCTLPWAPHRGSRDDNASGLSQLFLQDDNVLYLYAIQQALLTPAVSESTRLRDGLQHVDLVWTIKGEQLYGSGSSQSKKAAKREAARRILWSIPISEEAATQMRKQILNVLKMRLSATVVSDGPTGLGSANSTQHSHRIVWRVPNGNGRAPLDLCGVGTGSSAQEALARALEALYFDAEGRPSLVKEVAEGRAEQRRLAEDAKLGKASQERRKLIDDRMSQLNTEAASDVNVRHNRLVQKMRIQARADVISHQSGYHCSLQWNWSDSRGVLQERRTNGLGSSKSIAQAEAMQSMMIREGLAANVGHEALNAASRIRALSKNADPRALVAATVAFMSTFHPSCWSLAVIDAWQKVLASSQVEFVYALREGILQGLSNYSGPPRDRHRIPWPLLELLLDSCAQVASKETAFSGLMVLDKLPSDEIGFSSSQQRDYFTHFRLLLAWERVGQNQSALQDILRLGDESDAILLEQTNCVLPLITLEPRGESARSVLLSEVRAGDVVFLRPCSSDGSQRKEGHLANVTSVTRIGNDSNVAREGSGLRLTVRTSALFAGRVQSDGDHFAMHLLDSDRTSLRMVAALRSLAAPIVLSGFSGTIGATSGFSPKLSEFLLGTFRKLDFSAHSCWAEQDAGICAEEGAFSVEAAAAARRMPLTSAQQAVVRSALSRRLTLVHGPPGTGKTTASAFVVLAWRSAGEKILCVADSNAAADRLHESLSSWGVKSVRFGSGSSNYSKDGLGKVCFSSPGGLRKRSASGNKGGESGYQRLVAMRKAIDQFQVVVTTCSSSGHELLSDMSFPRVLIDECTQSIEPSTLVPLSKGCERLVLVGDHRQLPPTVVTPQAQAGGLDESLFTRLMKICSGFSGVVLLDEQRRMHPSIAAFPNARFYGGRIRDAAMEKAVVPGLPWRSSDFRVLMIDVGHCSELEERLGTSLRSAVEVQAALHVVQRIIASSSNAETESVLVAVAAGEIAILTPYAEQKLAFDKALKHPRNAALGGWRSEVRVSTIDSFQGSECDVIVFSAVRSNFKGQLGFLQDERRANVVLTRARRGLVVVGDAETMRRATGSIWAEWLQWVESKDAVIPLRALGTNGLM